MTTAEELLRKFQAWSDNRSIVTDDTVHVFKADRIGPAHVHLQTYRRDRHGSPTYHDTYIALDGPNLYHQIEYALYALYTGLTQSDIDRSVHAVRYAQELRYQGD